RESTAGGAGCQKNPIRCEPAKGQGCEAGFVATRVATRYSLPDLGVGPLRRRVQRCSVSPGSAGALAGGVRCRVACSKAYASAIRRGSLKRGPEKVTPEGKSLAMGAVAATSPPSTVRLG